MCIACRALEQREDASVNAAAILRRALSGEIPQQEAIREAVAILEPAAVTRHAGHGPAAPCRPAGNGLCEPAPEGAELVPFRWRSGA